MLVHIHHEPEPSKRQKPRVVEDVLTVRNSVEGVLNLVLTDGGTMTVHDWTRVQVWRYPSKQS